MDVVWYLVDNNCLLAGPKIADPTERQAHYIPTYLGCRSSEVTLPAPAPT